MDHRTVEQTETQLRKAIESGDVDDIMRLGADLDALTPPRPNPPLLGSALWYAERGIPVFALTPMSKVPRKGSNGVDDATTDPDIIRRWWTDEPRANVGLATGYRFDVCDIDGPQGVRVWARMPDRPHVFGRVSTPRVAGCHRYVAARQGYTNRANMFPGIDYRGRGGYVVAPPSRTQQGTYVWVKPLTVDVV